MKAIHGFLCFTILCVISFTTQAAYHFYDGFESGDMSASNSSGFRWRDENQRTLVNDSQVIFPTAGESAAGRSWKPKVGSNSMRFEYWPNHPWAEQRFDLGTPLPEIWIRYWIRVPENYKHEEFENRWGNNKWFSLWVDGYSAKGQASTIIWEYVPRGSSSALDIGYSAGCGGTVGNDNACGNSESHQQATAWINYPDDQGRWMQVVLHAKVESSDGADDGFAELYRRWEGESSFTQIHNLRDVSIRANPIAAGFQHGYILGHCNTGHDTNEDWLVDEFTISSESLLNIDDLSKPRPPSNIK